MNLLFFSSQYPPFVGGVSLAVDRVTRALAAAGDQVTVIARDMQDDTPAPLADLQPELCGHVNVYRVPGQLFGNRYAGLGLNLIGRIADAVNPDLVHTYFASVGYAARACAHRMGVPNVISCRGDDVTKNVLLGLGGTRTVLRCADHVVGVSQSMLTWAEIAAGCPHASYVPNSIAPDLLASPPTRDAARQQLGLPLDAVVLGTVYRHNWKKGPEYLKRLLLEIGRSDFPQLFLLVAGDPDSGFIRQLEADFAGTAHSGQRRELWNLGMVDRAELSAFLTAPDLNLLASRREGLPNALLESLACGTPVAGTRADGIVDVLEEERAGILLHRFDAEMAADKILQLLRDRPRLDTMSVQARELIRNRYMLEYEVGSLRSLYEDVLTRYRAQPRMAA